MTAGVPFLPGDRLRTTGGRIEVLFPDGSALEIDEYSSVDLLSPTLLRVTSGRIMLIVSGAEDPASAIRYQVDTPVASTSTDGPGEYRVALLSGPAGLEAELAVLRGLASIRTEQGSTSVRAGERSLARDLEAPSFPQVFNSARFDAFDRWSALRRDARTGTAQSAQYLPRELQMYGGTFDRYGAWQHEPQVPGTCGTRRPLPIGGRTITATGRRIVRTDGPGLAWTSGDGQRITTAAGASRAAGGSGFRNAGGRPRG